MHASSRSVAAALCASLGLAIVIGAIFGAASERAASERDAIEIAASGLWSSLALGAFALAGALAQPGRPSAALGLGQAEQLLPPWQVGAVICGFVGCSHLVYLAITLTPLHDMGVLGILERGLRGARGAALALAVAGVAIGPGVCEELLFRGLLLRGIARGRGRGVAVVASALLFAALHLDPVQGPGAFVLGLYLGAAALASGGTRVPILCHIINNLVALAAAVAGPEALATLPGAGLALASGAAASLGIVLLHRAAPFSTAR